MPTPAREAMTTLHLLRFRLPKLLFDYEVCGQCLDFVRETKVLEDVPSGDLVAEVRATEQAEKRLASYVQIATDAATDAEMGRMIVAGLKDQKELPALPPPEHSAGEAAAPGRRRVGRRARAAARSEC